MELAVNSRATEATKRRYDRISKVYDLMEKPVEIAFFKHWRKDLFRKVNGRVLEVGVGTGKNFPYYPKGTSVTAVDLSPKMIEKAKRKISSLSVKPSLALMDAQKLALKDRSFDTIVATFVFCSVPDAVKGFQELKRVCKPGGMVLLLEHVRSTHPLLGRLMDIFNPLTLKVSGVNINRETAKNILRSGLKLAMQKNLKGDVFKFFVARP